MVFKRSSNYETEPVWLVRSSARILGPFHLSEVNGLLQSRNLSILDEIRSPELRWAHIRDHENFREIVQSLRQDIDNTRDDTMTMTMTSTPTSHSGNTQTITNPILEAEKNEGLIPVVISTKIVTEVPNQEKMKGSQVDSEFHSKKKPSLVSSYGVASDKRVRQQIQKNSFSLFFLISFLVVVGAGVFGFSIWKKNRDRVVQFDGLMSKAIRLKNVGIYDKSLIAYKRAQQIKEPSFDKQQEMAFLFLMDQNLFPTAKRVFDKTLQQEDLSNAQLAESLLGQGLVYLRESNFKLGLDNFQRVLGLDPNNQSAIVNLAVARIRLGLFGDAFTDLSISIKQFQSNPMVQLTHALSGIEVWEKRKDSAILRQVLFELNKYLQSRSFLRQQLALMRIYVGEMLNDKSEIQNGLSIFLSEPIAEDELFLKDATVDWSFSTSDYLDRFNYELYFRHKSHKGSHLFAALRAVGLMRVHRENEAIGLINEAISQAPKDPLVLLTQANIMVKMGNNGEANVVLRNLGSGDFRLRELLLAQMCQTQQNLPCMIRSSQALSSNSPDLVNTFYWSAYLAMRQSLIREARERIKGGLLVEPFYLPLLELRDQLDFQGNNL